MSGRPRGSRRLVPAYLATYGRANPSRNTLDRLSVLHVPDAPGRAGGPGPAGGTGGGPDALSGLRPEERRLLDLLRPGALSLAEASAHLRLPVSVVKVLVADLVDTGHLQARPPAPEHRLPEREILEKVLDGLRTLKSS
ncbi:DUF742 domain-containing protein [Streptomyces armeniacus]|uniref:DUF742 domain-containing protein n=1 Tax=Streptomyces armeniacus TaxID=83291 RepID=A0A345XSI2_9ACTN|nr:DUF742 domain-containing protein [Streptomyces armeniacus]AXK34598.1 DUF742 domain-containing protein [Streptomyces armeniacus]